MKRKTRRDRSQSSKKNSEEKLLPEKKGSMTKNCQNPNMLVDLLDRLTADRPEGRGDLMLTHRYRNPFCESCVKKQKFLSFRRP